MGSAWIRLRSTVLVGLVCVGLLVPCLSLASRPKTWKYSRNWFWSQDWPFVERSGRNFFLCFDIGGAYTVHPVSIIDLGVAPSLFQASTRLTLWFQHSVGIYGVYGYAPYGLYRGSQFYGGGLKISFLTQVSMKDSSIIRGTSIQLVGEYINYSFLPNDSAFYEPTGGVFRPGISIDWGISTVTYINTTMLVYSLQGQLFVYPYLGIGFQF